VDLVEVSSVTYIHFMFDQHEVVLSDGAWTESFQPGDQTLDGLGEEQRAEIFELFPELKSRQGLETYAAARRSLKKHEAHLLTHSRLSRPARRQQAVIFAVPTRGEGQREFGRCHRRA
jgi:hypothetical protein